MGNDHLRWKMTTNYYLRWENDRGINHLRLKMTGEWLENKYLPKAFPREMLIDQHSIDKQFFCGYQRKMVWWNVEWIFRVECSISRVEIDDSRVKMVNFLVKMDNLPGEMDDFPGGENW